MNAGHQVIAAQMPLHSLINMGSRFSVKRAIDHIGGPVTLVGHSYGGFVITNAPYNNSNVTGLALDLAPDEGETGNDFFESLPEEFSKTFFESIVSDSAGCSI